MEYHLKEGPILLLGEGTFSFAVSLSQKLAPSRSLVATCFQDFSSVSTQTKANAKRLKSAGNDVHFSVDATKLMMNTALSATKFSNCIFNFPHAGGKSNLKLNRLLLQNCFRSTREVLSNNGRVFFTLCKGQGGTRGDLLAGRKWVDSWQVVALALEADLVLTLILPFRAEDYPSYAPVGYRSQEKGFCTDGALTYVFMKAETIKVPSVALVYDDKTCLPSAEIMFENKTNPIFVIRNRLLETARALPDVSVAPIALDHERDDVDFFQLFTIFDSVSKVKLDDRPRTETMGNTNEYFCPCQRHKKESQDRSETGFHQAFQTNGKFRNHLETIMSSGATHRTVLLGFGSFSENHFDLERPPLHYELICMTQMSEIEAYMLLQSLVNELFENVYCKLSISKKKKPNDGTSLPYYSLQLKIVEKGKPDCSKNCNATPFCTVLQTCSQNDKAHILQSVECNALNKGSRYFKDVARIYSFNHQQTQKKHVICVLDLVSLSLPFLPANDWRILLKPVSNWHFCSMVDAFISSPLSIESPVHEHHITFWKNERFCQDQLLSLLRRLSGHAVREISLKEIYIHPETEETSFCYKIIYQSHDQPLARSKANRMQLDLRAELEQWLGPVLR